MAVDIMSPRGQSVNMQIDVYALHLINLPLMQLIFFFLTVVVCVSLLKDLGRLELLTITSHSGEEHTV